MSLLTFVISAPFNTFFFKPLSVARNEGHVGQNSRAQVARIVRLQTDAVVVTETGFSVSSIQNVSELFKIRV